MRGRIDKVSRLLLSFTAQSLGLGIRAELVEVNGQPGAIFFTPDGLIVNVVSLDITDGLVQAIRGVVNPDKLRHLGPVANMRAMVHEARSVRRVDV